VTEFQPRLQRLEDRSTPSSNPLGVEFIVAGTAADGERVQQYAKDGSLMREFNPYPGFTGGVHVASGDVTGDEVPDVVTGAGPGGGPHVKVFDGATGKELASFFAFDSGFRGGVNVAAANGRIVVGAGPGGGPHVKVFDGATGKELANFFAFDSGFRGGVNVAVADGRIVVGAGPGGGPHVKVIDAARLNEVQASGIIANTALLANFFAFDLAFTGGVSVAAGDLNGDRVPDMVVGAGPGGAPHVRALDGVSKVELASFFAFDSGFRGGVNVAVADGRIVVGAGPGGGPHVKVINAARLNEVLASGIIANTALLADFFASDLAFNGGVPVAASEVTVSRVVQAELLQRWNAVAADMIFDVPIFGSISFIWMDYGNFPHPTTKGGSAEAYGAFAKVLVAFLQTGDNFEFLAKNDLFMVELTVPGGLPGGTGWTFAGFAKQFSDPGHFAFAQLDNETRKAIQELSAKIDLLA
jgi:hypothetical protein